MFEPGVTTREWTGIQMPCQFKNLKNENIEKSNTGHS